jgi:hypothetical protein
MFAVHGTPCAIPPSNSKRTPRFFQVFLSLQDVSLNKLYIYFRYRLFYLELCDVEHFFNNASLPNVSQSHQFRAATNTHVIAPELWYRVDISLYNSNLQS